METDEVLNCVSCNKDASLITSDGNTVCHDCVRVCERCNTIGSESWDFRTVDDAIWCEPCAESYSNYCESCEVNHTGDNYYAEDRSGTWCEDCWNDTLTYCEGCSCYYYNPCDCYDENIDIHDYSYTPDLEFHSNNDNPTSPADHLYFGIEIEVEAPRGDWGIRKQAAAFATANLESYDLAYLKSDGSLECGFEIVTHPMTHDYFKNSADKYWEVLEHLRSHYRMRSWSAGTTGLHIHISRAGFNNGAHSHRFLQLVYNNEEFYSKIAGRTSGRWAKFDDVHQWDSTKEKSVKSFKRKLAPYRANTSDRYSAVNTLNRNTFEMRIFRSTLNGNTVKSALDLAHASVEYTRSLTVNQVVNGALERMNFIQFIYNNSDTYSHLISRMDRLFIGANNQDTE